MAKKLQPAPLIPFRLHDISDFVVDEHPTLFPESPEYKLYWDDQIRWAIEGKWGYDFNEDEGGGWRWCPPGLYFHTNFCVIKVSDKQGNEVSVSPLLRDVEWFLFYAFVTCDGFSGFDGDDTYTCFRTIGKIQQGKELSHAEQIELQEIEEEFGKDMLRKPNGEYKEYIEAREYLYQTFDKPMGKAFYFNEMLNLIVLSTRGVGKSYGVGNGVIGHDFVFNGARTFEDFVGKKTNSTIVVGSALTSKSDELLSKFKDSYDHIKKLGSYKRGEYKKSGVIWRPTTGSLSAKSNTSFSNKYSLEKRGGRAENGSYIVHVSFHNNISAGVGYRARRMIVEEAGLLGNFKGVHGENVGSKERDKTSGYTIYIGTGGDIEKIQGIREAFNNPDGYSCLAFDDVFNGNKNQIGLFIPCYYRKNIYKDKNGNTDIEKAFEDETSKREELRKLSSVRYQRHIISFPMVPQEMFLNNQGNPFPTDVLESRLAELEQGEWKRMADVGHFVYLDKEKRNVKWYRDISGKLTPIRRFGEEKDLFSLEGGIVIYEHPEYAIDPTFKNPKYLVVYDPVRDPGSGTSLASILVIKMWEPELQSRMQMNVVAEWIGRYSKLEDMHEIALQLACHFKAKVLPETNNRDFIRHCTQTSRYDMLQPEPSLALDGAVKSRKQKYNVGVYISPGMIPVLEGYASEVLDIIVKQNESIIGDEHIVEPVTVAGQLNSMRLCEELIYYDRDGNYDHVSSFFLFGIWSRQQKLEPVVDRTEEKSLEKSQRIKAFFNPNKPKNKQVGFNY